MGMRVRAGLVVTAGLALRLVLLTGAAAQTHKVAAPESVVRAVGVYEWTGDLAKPVASRLIPVTLFIDGKLEDAGVYQARPVPFALLSGNYYELQQSGLAKGGLELSFARHLQAVNAATGESAFDDGWFGYGSFHAPAAEKKETTLRASSTLSEVTGSKDGSRPHFGNKSAEAADRSAADKSTAGNSGASRDGTDRDGTDKDGTDKGGTTDAERPTMRRRGAGSTGAGSNGAGSNGSGSSTAKGSGDAAKAGADAGTPGEDPDRPHLSKKSTSNAEGADPDTGTSSPVTAGSESGTATGSSDSAKSTPESAQGGSGGSANDPDRPTLKRRSAEEIRRDRTREDKASVTAVGSLNDDPNRPNLHRGKPASAMTEDDLPKLMGLPVDLKHMVAVSDAANRTPHDFSRPWEDDKERLAILATMQALARAKVAAYGRPQETEPAVSKTPAPKAPVRRAAASSRVKKTTPAGSGIVLLGEDLKSYLLSYGGAATYVYTAHTAGDGASLDYVTVVAQADAMGALKPAIESVTDAAHLDRTPRMRLVDAVDVEASNRASLLFELRGQRSRQFGLYRVIGAKAEEIFVSGSTQ